MQRLISKNWLRLSLIFVTSFGVSLGAASIVRILVFPPQAVSAEPEPEVAATETAEEPIVAEVPKFISLQEPVETWAIELDPTASIAVKIYDLDNNQPAAEYRSSEVLSSVALTELMTDYLKARSSITEGTEQLIEQLELSNTSSDGAYTNANDAYIFLQFLWEHSELTQASWDELQDNLLGQLISENGEDLRQGFARGITNARVYTKTSTELLNNASPIYSSIGFFEMVADNRHYALVLLGNLTDEDAENLGAIIERELM